MEVMKFINPEANCLFLYRGDEKLMKKNPIAIVEKAVKGMLPKSRLGREQFRNLYVYAGTEHTHEAQQPKKINLNSIK